MSQRKTQSSNILWQPRPTSISCKFKTIGNIDFPSFCTPLQNDGSREMRTNG
nr:MAG TPA: hypothetical protein [Caudoviricetes sp.]